MKLKTILKSYVAPLAVALTLAHPVAGQEAAGEGVSKHYAAVSKHLDIGGVFFGYVDMDEDMASLNDFIADGLKGAKESGIELPEIDVKAMLKALGLFEAKALGMSSQKRGEYFHNKAFLAMPGGPKGLMKTLGGAAAPFASSTLAPAGTDLIVEEDISLKAVLGVIDDLFASVKGKSEELTAARKGMDEALSQPAGPLPMTMRELIEKMDTKITVIGKFDDKKKLSFPEAKLEVPLPHLVIAFDRMDWLFNGMAKQMADGKQFELKEGDGFDVLSMLGPLPEPMSAWAPVAYLDKATKRLLIGTSLEYIKECLGNKSSVTDDADYKVAMKDLPKEGNGVSYASKNASKTLREIAKQAISSASMPEEQRAMVEKLYGMLLPKNDLAVGTVRANLPEGILFASNTYESHKTTVLTAAVYPMAAAFGVIGSQTFMRRQPMPDFDLEEGGMDEDGEGAAPRPRNNVRPAVLPEEKVKVNLLQIALAAEAFFLDDADAKEVDYNTLVKREFLFKLLAVSGEDYSTLKLKRSGGTLQVVLKNGKSVTHKYSAITD